MGKIKNRYEKLIEEIFFQNYKKGDKSVSFHRTELEKTAKKLHIDLPKNLGDIIYTFKFRAPLPEKIIKTADPDKEWVIKNVGRSEYRFEQVKEARILPDPMMLAIKIPDAIPGIVEKYALDDEQALLAKVRYNRLIDIFTGVTCYSLQNHLRTTVPGIGQVETDEIYVGIDKNGRQYVFPVQAKGGKDEIGIVQIEQDIKLCEHKYPNLICRALAAQFIDKDKISIFELALEDNEIKKVSEKHYKLVPSDSISDEEIESYNHSITN